MLHCCERRRLHQIMVACHEQAGEPTDASRRLEDRHRRPGSCGRSSHDFRAHHTSFWAPGGATLASLITKIRPKKTIAALHDAGEQKEG